MHVVRQTEDNIWFAAHGNHQYVYVANKGTVDKFLGGGFLVKSEAELEK